MSGDNDYKTYAEVLEEAKKVKRERERKSYLELATARSTLTDEVSNSCGSSAPPRSIALH
jgi:hypothetical protein